LFADYAYIITPLLLASKDPVKSKVAEFEDMLLMATPLRPHRVVAAAASRAVASIIIMVKQACHEKMPDPKSKKIRSSHAAGLKESLIFLSTFACARRLIFPITSRLLFHQQRGG
jgi:hypothetical protein